MFGKTVRPRFGGHGMKWEQWDDIWWHDETISSILERKNMRGLVGLRYLILKHSDRDWLNNRLLVTSPIISPLLGIPLKSTLKKVIEEYQPFIIPIYLMISWCCIPWHLLATGRPGMVRLWRTCKRVLQRTGRRIPMAIMTLPKAKGIQRDPKGSKGYSLLMFVVHVELLHGCWRSNILPYIHIVCRFEFINRGHAHVGKCHHEYSPSLVSKWFWKLI